MIQPAVYILASKRNGTLYIGVTSNLRHRIHQHRDGLIDGFTKKYNIKLLVHYEFHEHMPGAIAREKELKRFRRAWKLDLIEERNPQWTDLWDEIV